MKDTTDACEILRALFVLGNPESEARIAADHLRLNLIDTIRDLREKSGLTRGQLADKVGMSVRQISQLENPLYENQALSAFQAVIGALGCRLDLKVVTPFRKKRRAKAAGAA